LTRVAIENTTMVVIETQDERDADEKEIEYKT